MSKIKLVIEIDESDYEAIRNDGVQNHIALADEIIRNGTPIEGDLISRSELIKGECKTCKHYNPIMQRDMFGYSPRGDGYCDIRRMTQDGELEINVNDDFYCKYYERGDENGKS